MNKQNDRFASVPSLCFCEIDGMPGRAGSVAWHAIYLMEAFATLRRRREEISETTIAHIAPLGWEHIYLIGNYHFTPQPGRSLDNLRPLRPDLPHTVEEARLPGLHLRYCQRAAHERPGWSQRLILSRAGAR